MPYKIILIFIFALCSGIFYRIGGMSKKDFCLSNTKWRDLGVPIIALITMLFSGINFSWMLVLSTLLLFASLTTYWKKISKWIGKDTENVYYYNWFATGLFYGLAYLPMCFAGISVSSILIRAIVLASATMYWSEMIDDVNWEEGGRGFLITITTLLLK